jgi:hypothetical protein
VASGRECRDLHNVTHASGAGSGNGVVLQLHHVVEIVRQQEHHRGTVEGGGQRLWLGQIPGDPCDARHRVSFLQISRQRARRYSSLRKSPQDFTADQTGTAGDENRTEALRQ